MTVYFTLFCDHCGQGIPGGEENGKKGYMLTFVIAYIRVSELVQ